METLVSVKSNHLSETFSLKALRIVIENLPRLRENLKDYEARENMCYASFLMGWNLSLAGTLLPHRMQYVIGNLSDSSHGAGLLTLYPGWLKEEYKYSSDKMDCVAKMINNDSDTVKSIIDFVESFGIRKKLGEMGFSYNDLDMLVDNVQGKMENDSAYKGRETIKRIFEESL